MLAIVIFALLSPMVTQILRSILQNHQRIQDKTQDMAQIQLALALMAMLAVGINQFWYSPFNRTLTRQSCMQAKWALLGAKLSG